MLSRREAASERTTHWHQLHVLNMAMHLVVRIMGAPTAFLSVCAIPFSCIVPLDGMDIGVLPCSEEIDPYSWDFENGFVLSAPQSLTK